MADKSLQTRTMRKTMERVDIGTFGIPMRVINWTKKKKASWTGLISLILGQMLIGALIAAPVALITGITVNAFSIAIFIFFLLGCAIGGPFSFSVWTALLIGITTPIAGIFGSAWIGSPSWWRELGASWDAGQSIPGWFLIAVPIWVLFWVGAARGIAKVSEVIFEKLALRMGFGAAKRFMGEEQRVFDEAYRQSDVSEAETASLLETSGTGTHSLITGEPSKIGGTFVPKTMEMGGDPDISSVPLPSVGTDEAIDYSKFIEMNTEDEDVLKASGISPSALEKISPEDGEPSTGEAVSLDKSSDNVVEMPALDLPAIPTDTSSNVQKVKSPKIPPLQNRVFTRRMVQIKTIFDKMEHEDRHAEFIEKFRNELSVLSDEEERFIQSLEGTGPLMAIIASIKAKKTDDFIAGRAPAPLAPGVGSISFSEDDETEEQISSAVYNAENDEKPSIPDVKKDDKREQMLEALFSAQRRKRPIVDAVTSNSDNESAPTTATEEAVEADPVVKMDSSAISEDNSEEHDSAPNDNVDPVKLFEATEASSDFAAEIPDVIADPLDNSASSPLVFKDGDRVMEFDVAIEETRNSDPVVVPSADEIFQSDLSDTEDELSEPETLESDDSIETVDADENKDIVEVEMGETAFGSILCRQVLGLVIGSKDPAEKADIVSKYERENPGISVDLVLNSREFDVEVGHATAAAARHSWKDIKQILAEPVSTRLINDYKRVNARARNMIEEPQTLTISSFNAFENESMRLRKTSSQFVGSASFRECADLMHENVSLSSTLKSILVDRTSKNSNGFSVGSGPVARVKVPAGQIDKEEIVTPTASKSTVGKILGLARDQGTNIIGQLSSKEIKKEPVSDDNYDAQNNEDTPEADVNFNEEMSQPMKAKEETVSNSNTGPAFSSNEPKLGDDGFVSKHPVGSDEYEMEMSIHEFALKKRLEILEAKRLQKEEEERQAELERRAEEEKRQAEIREKMAQQEAQEKLRTLSEELNEERIRRQMEIDARHRENMLELERKHAEETLRLEQDKIKLQNEAAENLRRETELKAKKAEADYKLSLELAKRSKEEEVIIKQLADRQGELQIPDRFRTTDIIAQVLVFSELRNTRKVFQRTNTIMETGDMSDDEKAIRFPSFRSANQLDVEIGREAQGIISKICEIVDPTDPEDMNQIRSLLDKSEQPFFGKIEGEVARGQSAQELISRADQRWNDIILKARKADEAKDIEVKLKAASEELESLKAENNASSSELETASSKVAELEKELDNANKLIKKLKNELDGIIDDDVQEFLEAHGTSSANIGIPGFFTFGSKDRKTYVIFCTLTTKNCPDGTLHVGSKAFPISDIANKVIYGNTPVQADDILLFFFDRALFSYVVPAEIANVNNCSVIEREKELIVKMLSGKNIDLENGE